MTKFVKVSIPSSHENAITGRFPSGYDYAIPSSPPPADVVAIFTSLGGYCLLHTSKFTEDAAQGVANLSCHGLAYIAAFLGDHPFAATIIARLHEKTEAIISMYDAIVAYARSTSDMRCIVLMTTLDGLFDIIDPRGDSRRDTRRDGDSINSIITAAINIIVAELWTIPDDLLHVVDHGHEKMMSTARRDALDMMAIGMLYASTMRNEDEISTTYHRR